MLIVTATAVAVVVAQGEMLCQCLTERVHDIEIRIVMSLQLLCIKQHKIQYTTMI
jgi:hypothetical protein